MFVKANQFIKEAVLTKNQDTRINQLNNVRQTLGESLAIYDDPDLLKGVLLIGQLRHRECSWIIEQTIALTYQLHNEFESAYERLSSLKQKIYEDCKYIANNCTTEEERDILFPELLRIYWCDLPTLTFWQNGLKQLRLTSEINSRQNAHLDAASSSEYVPEVETRLVPEEKYYDEIKRRSHALSLNDQLKMMMDDDLRQDRILYINSRFKDEGHKALTSDNLVYASNMAIANLYWYFKNRENTGR